MNSTLHTHQNLDETDLAIIERVEEDFDISLETLADELDLSKSAIHLWKRCYLTKPPLAIK